MNPRIRAKVGPLLLFLLPLPGSAAEPQVQVVVQGLVAPCAVAARPESDQLFLAERGAGRIVRIVNNQAVEVVRGFGKSTYAEGPKHELRPLGLWFLDANTLLVGGGDVPDGEGVLRIYDLTKLGETPLELADAKVVASPVSQEKAGPAKARFYAVAATKEAVFLSCRRDDGPGWIARGAREASGLGAFARALPTADSDAFDAPLALIVSRRGYLVAGQIGDTNTPHDSLLAFYHPKNMKLLLRWQTGLYDVTGLAYSDKTGHLYATDAAWMAPAEGGLFQLIARKPTADPPMEAPRITRLDKPTALAFGADGSLYVTILGSSETGGKLLKFDPGL